MRKVSSPLRRQDSGDVVAERLWVADGFFSRLVGLQFRKSLPAGTALLLIPCRSIHTAFCRFPLDVAAIDRRGRVVDVRRQLSPWSVFMPAADAHAMLELPAGQLILEPGDLLCIEWCEPDPLPASLRFLHRTE